MKGQKGPNSMSLLRMEFGRNSLGLELEPKGVKRFNSWELGYEETGVISPQAATCCVCNALEIACVSLVQHCPISLPLTLSHCMKDLLNIILTNMHPLLKLDLSRFKVKVIS